MKTGFCQQTEFFVLKAHPLASWWCCHLPSYISHRWGTWARPKPDGHAQGSLHFLSRSIFIAQPLGPRGQSCCMLASQPAKLAELMGKGAQRKSRLPRTVFGDGFSGRSHPGTDQTHFLRQLLRAEAPLRTPAMPWSRPSQSSLSPLAQPDFFAVWGDGFCCGIIQKCGPCGVSAGADR